MNDEREKLLVQFALDRWDLSQYLGYQYLLASFKESEELENE